eukprot:TRINITY_DN68208_c4_g1_i1.p1 TRINITY_DN68208_c4_g1~~TRINITY_DN68208_c4_g1_i1.p1  ORF type:complete len:100 (+),score=5.18 TRINITY_DN68208_c4_g1_i1:546-845(+)
MGSRQPHHSDTLRILSVNPASPVLLTRRGPIGDNGDSMYTPQKKAREKASESPQRETPTRTEAHQTSQPHNNNTHPNPKLLLLEQGAEISMSVESLRDG